MVKCPYCGREYSDAGIKNHLSETNSLRVGRHGCPYLYSVKDDVIEDYKSMSIRDIAEKYKVRFDQVSASLKFWGVKVNAQDNNRYDNMGKWIPFNTEFFDEEYMDETRYWLLGMLASDGSVNKNNNQIVISQSGESGKDIINYIKTLIDSEYEIRCTDTCLNGSYNKSYSLHFSSKKVKNRLAEFNIIPNKTYSFTFPDNIPDEFLPSFICGYTEGDGLIGCYSVGGTSTFCKVILAGTEQFIKECSIRIPFKNVAEKCENSVIWKLTLNGKNAIEFCDWIYSSDKIYKNSKKYKNYIKCKEAHEKTNRYASKVDAEKLLEYVIENGFVNVMEYAKSHPEHHFQNYYEWLHKFEEQGLIEQNQYKMPKQDTRSEKTIKLENMIKDRIENGTFSNVRDFLTDINMYTKSNCTCCRRILKRLVSDGYITEDVRKSFLIRREEK